MMDTTDQAGQRQSGIRAADRRLARDSAQVRPAAEEPTDGAGFARPTSLGRRLLWFAGLWAAGVASVATVAYILRLWISPS